MAAIEYKSVYEEVQRAAATFNGMGLRLQVSRTGPHARWGYKVDALTGQNKPAYVGSMRHLQLQEDFHFGALSARTDSPDMGIVELYQQFTLTDGRTSCVAVPSGITGEFNLFKANDNKQPEAAGSFRLGPDNKLIRLDLDF